MKFKEGMIQFQLNQVKGIWLSHPEIAFQMLFHAVDSLDSEN